MKNKLKYILIFGFSIFIIGCAFGKNIQNNSSFENQLNNKKSEEKSDEINNVEDNKTTNEKSEGKSNIEYEENKAVASKNKKIIYLTFDDGPSYKVTNSVLDILKENKVNGTFFLIGNQIKGKEKIVKRIYNEGNCLGLHSYTHNYKKIYSSEDNFIKEMFDCRDEVKKVVGISPNIIRFPGGSHKRLSKNLLMKLHEKNFKVHDWNLDNCDGLKPKTSPEELYEKAIERSEKKKRIVLLLHCADVHENTHKALPKIIKYYKSQGYEFRTITEETTELYFPIVR